MRRGYRCAPCKLGLVNALLLSLSALAPLQQDPAWPDYRGPALDGHAPAGASLPLTWSEEENVAWKTEVWGRGWSSPVVADGRVWMTTADPEGHRYAVVCVDLESGKVLLDRLLFEVEEPMNRNDLNSYASPSPVVGGGRVVVLFGSVGMVCLDAQSGERVWHFQMVHHGLWDLDPPAPPILMDVVIDGRPRKIVAQPVYLGLQCIGPVVRMLLLPGKC